MRNVINSTSFRELDGKLFDDYELVFVKDDGQYCTDGGESTWDLLKNDQLVHTFRSCHCGRGCGNKDCVRDDWGYHDCEPEIEAVRIDHEPLVCSGAWSWGEDKPAYDASAVFRFGGHYVEVIYLEDQPDMPQDEDFWVRWRCQFHTDDDRWFEVYATDDGRVYGGDDALALREMGIDVMTLMSITRDTGKLVRDQFQSIDWDRIEKEADDITDCLLYSHEVPIHATLSEALKRELATDGIDTDRVWEHDLDRLYEFFIGKIVEVIRESI